MKQTAQIRTEVGTFSVAISGQRITVDIPHPRTPSQVAVLELLNSKRKVSDRYGSTVQINGKRFHRAAYNQAKVVYWAMRAAIKEMKQTQQQPETLPVSA